MAQRPVVIEDKNRPPARKPDPLAKRDDHPEDDNPGSGDICSLEEQPSTDDDKPLD